MTSVLILFSLFLPFLGVCGGVAGDGYIIIHGIDDPPPSHPPALPQDDNY